ncbi:MAG: methylmalonyl Co-A mutase-associated GTPase MeaB [Cyclobacteriaceae bacterium]
MKLSIKELTADLLNGSTVALARAITLCESSRSDDQKKASQLLTKVGLNAGNSIRIGITGSPGVGKSTFIEAFGKHLTSHGKKIAILAIDPSSTKTKGSILGDRTRMEELSKDKLAFIRPTATGNSLGGVADKTREAILLCEAAGYEIIIVETVGVGQSETAVRNMVDFFLLLQLPGGGDELQGIKKGIMEMADGIVITKADGENEKKAKLAQAEFQHALHLFQFE